MFIQTYSKFVNYTLYQTDDLCRSNWKESVCIRSFFLHQTNQPFLISLKLNDTIHCLSQILVYIRPLQCIYCAKTLSDIHCNRRRLRRMIPREKSSSIHRNTLTVIGLSLFGVFLVGSLFTLLFIKRTQAHTNLLELKNTQSNLRAINQIKIPTNIKSIKSKHLTIPKPNK